MCEEQLDWDTVVPENISKSWKEFVILLKSLKSIRIPRLILIMQTKIWSRSSYMDFAIARKPPICCSFCPEGDECWGCC